MAPAPERTVHVDAVGPDGKALDRLARQYGLVHRRASQRKVLDAGRRGCRAGERLVELGLPHARVPKLEVVPLPDHHGLALELAVLAQRRREEDASGAVGRHVFLEAEQQALPPARLGIEARKGLDPRAHRLPGRLGVDEHAPLGVRGEDHGFGAVEQRAAMARGDSDASLRVERDDRGSVKRCPHMASCATFSYLLPLYG